MSVPKLSFEGLNQKDSQSFAKALFKARIFERNKDQHSKIRNDVSGLQVSFPNAGFFGIADLATLAVIIRTFAESGKDVTIDWPRPFKGRPSALQKYLAKLKFAELFAPGSTSVRRQLDLPGNDN